jgi:predicted cobalt transporter CbtA
VPLTAVPATPSVRTLLVRGMLAGVPAGLAAAVFAYLVGEPAIDGGIAFERHGAEAHVHAVEAHAAEAQSELVSRGVQSTIGLLVALLLYGVAIGGILALVYAAARGRVGPVRPRTAAAVLALVGFVVVMLVPFLKCPANPPGTSNADSIGQRTGVYLVMLLCSVLVAVLATALAHHLATRTGKPTAIVVGVAAYLLVMLVIGALLPPVNETPVDFPATLLYEFRVASLGMHLALWAVLGLVFAALVEPRRRQRDRIGL